MEFATLDALDISAANSGAKLELKDPVTGEALKNKDGTTPTLVVLGLDSDVYRKITRRKVMGAMKDKRAGKRSLIDEDIDRQIEVSDAEAIDMMVAMTLGWENFFDPKGAKIAFSKQAVRELYAKYPLIREQVDAFAADRANFTKRQSGN
jgi:hypothetical protein